MSHRRVYIGIAGLLLGLIGLGALGFPVYLDQFDVYGMKISCGNGIGSHVVQTQVDGTAAARCGTALLVRRLWAFPTVVIGWSLVTWFLVMWAHVQQQDDEDVEPQHYVPHPEIAGPTTTWWNSGRN